MLNEILDAIWLLIKVLFGLSICSILLKFLLKPISDKIKERKIKKELDKILNLLKDGKFNGLLEKNNIVINPETQEIRIEEKEKE